MAIDEEEYDDQEIIDVDESEDEPPVVVYDISNYGVDYDVEGLVKRLDRGDIFIPEFQRDYVWNQVEASRLIESLLLGLPIPGVFLAKDSDTNKLSVIDGQQRMKSLQFFINGFFNPKKGDNKKRVFKLVKVQKKFEGKTFADLDDDDRLMLNDSIVHATIIKQETPNDDNTSIYHVFERLNTGGRKLTSQEIRAAIYVGKLNSLIDDLNDNEQWRQLFGKKNNRLKDKEMILRFFAMYYRIDSYSKPLNEFMNKFNIRYKNPSDEQIDKMSILFKETVNFILEVFGKNAFRPERVFNAATFEVLMVGFAKLIDQGLEIEVKNLQNDIHLLYEDSEFAETITRATSDDKIVKRRHELFDKFISGYVGE